MVGEEADEVPAIELSTGASVEGVPFACVAPRLTWPQEKSSILNKEGGAVTRMPSGPQSLEDVPAETDKTYFDMRQALVDDVFNIVGCDSVQTD